MRRKELIKKHQIYGRWEVVGELSNSDYVKCKCECGVEREIKIYHLLNGVSKSCGCLQREIMVQLGRKLLTKHNGSKTKLFRVWVKMRQRCNNQYDDSYNYYGAKGITVCPEWESFEEFRKWALGNGYSECLTIDRIDGNKNYEPSNCRFVDMTAQNNNKSNNIQITINGTTKTLVEWCRHYGVNYKAAWSRYARGKTIFVEVE
jgi:hypothetical protein